MQKNKVIIIGAGISGISASIYLAKMGFDVEIFETKNFIGGRTYSFKPKSINQVIDNGQHLFMSAYTNFLKVLKELGTDKKLKIQENLDIKFYSKNRTESRLSSYPFTGRKGFLFALLKMSNLSYSDKINVIDLFVRLRFIKRLKKRKTVFEFLKSNHQQENIINNFWQPLCLAVMNSSVVETDANLFIKVLKQAFFSSQASSKLIFPALNLSELLMPFTQWLDKHNGKIHFKSRVDKILIENDKAIGIKVNNQIFKADYYISTVQPYILNKILKNQISKDLSKNLEEYRYSTIISIYLWLNREIISEDFAALLGTNTQWIFNLNKFNKSIKTQNHLIELTISNADKLNDLQNSEIIKLCWNELNEIFPATRRIKILDYFVIKNKRSTFKATPSIVAKRLNSDIGFSNLFIAGDWVNTNLPATIEGACVSGINCVGIISGKELKS